MSNVIVKVKEMFSFQQQLSGKTVRHFVDRCQKLKKLSVDRVFLMNDNDVLYVIDRLGKQLTSLVLYGNSLTDVAYLYLKNCTR
jgi:hypothetical protein